MCLLSNYLLNRGGENPRKISHHIKLLKITKKHAIETSYQNFHKAKKEKRKKKNSLDMSAASHLHKVSEVSIDHTRKEKLKSFKTKFLKNGKYPFPAVVY